MMLAQLPEPSHFASIGWACVIIVMIFAGINQVLMLWHRIKDRPTGGEVRSETHEKFATKPELAQVKAELNQRIVDVDEDLQAQKRSIVENGEKRKASIEGKVESVRKEISADVEKVAAGVSDAKVAIGEFRGELKQINLTLMNLNSSLQHLHVQQAKHHGKE